MAKYVEKIPEEAKKFFSINFFMAELHEMEQGTENNRFKEPERKDVSSEYKDHNFDAYSFHKRVSSVLGDEASAKIKDLDK